MLRAMREEANSLRSVARIMIYLYDDRAYNSFIDVFRRELGNGFSAMDLGSSVS